MAKIKVEAIIELSDFTADLTDLEELQWFTEMMNDKSETFLQVWNNDIGDEVGSTNSFKWEIINK